MRFIPNPDYRMDDIVDVSSDESYASDLIDSDIEAELYSTVYHEIAPTQPDPNPDVEKDSSNNLISVEESSKDLDKRLDSNCNRYINMAKRSNQIQAIENSDVSLKKKSNLVTNFLNAIQVKNNSPRKKQKTGNHLNQTIDIISSPGSSIIEIIDSDSDSSVILSEPEESSVRKLQTNIDTVDISSDSESSCENSRFSFICNKNDTNNSNYKDVWQIDAVDLYRMKRNYNGRYHENAASNCKNCNKKGHTAEYCTEPKVVKCIICGGTHMHNYCKNKICGKCLRYGHHSNRCYLPAPKVLCSICNVRGHSKKSCPDLWRRFHLTTSDGHIVKGDSLNHSRAIYCFNCGSEGHYGFDCRRTRMGQSPINWSSVISYEHPSVSENKFHMDSNFGGLIPQLQNQIPAQLQQQTPLHVSYLERKRLIRFHRVQEKGLKKVRKELKKVRSRKRPCKQETNVNSVFLNEKDQKTSHVKQELNLVFLNKKGQNTSHVKQEVNFPRTPKVNTNSPECQCVDEMPKFKQKRRAKKMSKKQKKEMLLRKQMQVL